MEQSLQVLEAFFKELNKYVQTCEEDERWIEEEKNSLEQKQMNRKDITQNSINEKKQTKKAQRLQLIQTKEAEEQALDNQVNTKEQALQSSINRNNTICKNIEAWKEKIENPDYFRYEKEYAAYGDFFPEITSLEDFKELDFERIVEVINAKKTNTLLAKVRLKLGDDNLLVEYASFCNLLSKARYLCDIENEALEKKGNSEIQILTNYDMVKEADHVKVSFEDGKQVTAQVIALDKTSQLAMLSVPLTELEDGTIACINKVRMLETQSMMEKGSPVIILGSPNGNVGSMGLSYIMEIIEDVPIVDGAQMQINTDFSVLGSGVSGLFDLKGRLIGIYTNNSDEKTSNAISISSIQDEIDLLESQSSIACLGVYGQEVTKEIATTHNLPYGIYITNLVEKGAAYKSGLQNGDVITKIGEATVFNLQSLKSEILKRENKEEVQVTVQRSGAKGYKEIVLNVKLGKR